MTRWRLTVSRRSVICKLEFRGGGGRGASSCTEWDERQGAAEAEAGGGEGCLQEAQYRLGLGDGMGRLPMHLAH
jgi:hypothetical protein